MKKIAGLILINVQKLSVRNYHTVESRVAENNVAVQRDKISFFHECKLNVSLYYDELKLLPILSIQALPTTADSSIVSEAA